MNQIQQKINYLKFIDKMIDIAIVFSAIIVSIISENIYHNKYYLLYDSQSFSELAFPLVVLIVVIFILYFENHFIYRLTNYNTIFINVFKISLFSLISLTFIDFAFKSELFFRTTILFFFIYSFIFLLMKRFIYKIYLSKIRSQGKDVKNILIIGINKITKQFIQNIQNHRDFGFNIESVLYEGENKYSFDGLEVDNIENINNVLLNKSIDEIFIIDIKDRKLSVEIINKLENMGINYHLVLDSDKFKISNDSSIVPKIDQLYDMPTISFYSVNATYYKLVIKNFVERISAFIILLFSLPVLILSMIAVKLTSKGPVIFSQERVGLRNRRFKQYKLRTMVDKADEIKESLMGLNEVDGAAFKMTNDPRITSVGKFLRKFSLDELPQLINVLKGEMNLIGPRPPVPSEVEKYQLRHYRRFSFKPGITGLWQVSGRNEIKNFEDWVKLDLEYIDNWSLTKDLWIALKTIPVVFLGSGK